MQDQGWKKVGTMALASTFMPSAQIYFPAMKTTAVDFFSPIKGRMLTIVTVEEEPFVSWVNKENTGSHRYGKEIQRNEVQGYCLDLLDELQHQLGFSYRLYYDPMNAFGSRDEMTGLWIGMVGELVEKVCSAG